MTGAKMQALRFHGQRDIRLEEIDIPACGKGQVKVGTTVEATLLAAPFFCSTRLTVMDPD